VIDLAIRPLEPSDARAVFDIATQPEVARAIGGTPFDSLQAHEQRFCASCGSANVERLGAFERGALVAFVELSRVPRARVSHAAHVMLAVRPSAQRRGVGAALLDAALDASDRWLHLVRLETELLADDALARGFLERRGFAVETRRRAALITDGAPADTITLGRLRPGFAQADGVLRPMPEPPPRRAAPQELVIRPVRPEDATALSRLSSDPTVLFGSAQTPTMGVEAWRRRLDGQAAEAFTALVESGGELVAIGSVHGYPEPRRRHTVWIGLSVAGPYQGMGIGDRLTTLLLDVAERWLGVVRVELQVFADNTRAVRLYEKHGFEREGLMRHDVWRDGGYADSLVMARVRSAAR
jgi:putative acetyltransferase